MKEKDLLIVYNCFGGDQNEYEIYKEELDNIFWNIETNNLSDKIRVVVSSVLNHSNTDTKLKEIYGDKISIITYKTIRPSVQVSFNKTVLASIENFQEEYKAYFYISSGVELPRQQELFPRILRKLENNDYGIIQLQVDGIDGGFGSLRQRYKDWLEIEKDDIENDFIIAIGDYCNFHIAIINKELKDFYGVPLLDVYGTGGMEGGVGYTSVALRKKHLILNSSMCSHRQPKSNSATKNDEIDWGDFPAIKDWLLWGRTNDVFLNDVEGIDAGLGNYPEWFAVNDYPFVVLPHKKDKYDENYLATDERLRHSVKRCYFTNKDELDYNNINYVLYK